MTPGQRRGRARKRAGLVLALLAFPLAAEPPELVTDRPDQTESAAIVPQGTVQVEVGATFTRDRVAGERLDSLEGPGTLARVGVGRRLELRFGWRGWVSTEARRSSRDSLAPRESETIEGMGDAQIGFKLGLRSSEGKNPGIALLGGATIPTGDAALTSGAVDPSVRLSFAHALTRRLSLGYNLGARRTSDPVAGGQTTSLVYTAVLGFPLTRQWGAFIEVFGETDRGSPGENRNSLDGGLTILARSHLQLDLAGGLGLSDAAEDWFVGLGLSIRLPQ